MKADKSELSVAGWSHVINSTLLSDAATRRFTAAKLLNLCSRRVGESSWRKKSRNVKARRADPIVGHSMIEIEAVR
ncbi:MAG: hypothetical protein WCE49_03320 [Terrimicrobiaceae bacterium]